MKLTPLFQRLLVLLLFLAGGAGVQAGPGWVRNAGQWPSQVLASLDWPAARVFLEKDRLVYHFLDEESLRNAHESGIGGDAPLKAHALYVNFVGASSQSILAMEGPSADRINYFLGRNRQASGLQKFRSVTLKQLWPGVDFVFHVGNDGPKYEFILAPGVPLSTVQLQYVGLDKNGLAISDDGRLLVRTSVNVFAEERPVAFAGEQNRELKARFHLNQHTVSFKCEGRNPQERLILDPVLVFSTFTGSLADNFGFTATYDHLGNLYGGGNVFGPGYPLTPGAYQTSFNDVQDAVFSVYSTGTPSQLLYSTYVGGSGLDNPLSMVVNRDQELYVLLKTTSPDFPVSLTGYDTSWNGFYDIALIRLSKNGDSLLSGTYVGGAGADGHNNSSRTLPYRLCYNFPDSARGEIQLDRLGKVWVVASSQSADFPITSGAFQGFYAGNQDVVLFRMDSTLSQLEMSTFYGGGGHDAGYGFAFTDDGNLYITGGTTTAGLGFPNTVYQPNFAGESDGFIAEFSYSGQRLRTTYVGTPLYDQSFFIQADRNGQLYAFGQSMGNMPITASAYHNTNGKLFVLRLDSTLSNLTLSTVLGNGMLDGKPGPDLSPTAFLVDVCNRIFVSGWGGWTNQLGNNETGFSMGLPLTPNAFQTTTDSSDFYLAVLESNAASLLFGSYFGGRFSREHVDGGTSRFDKKGVIYQSVCAGCFDSRTGRSHSDFPMFNADSTRNNSFNCNMALFKIDFLQSGAVADFDKFPRSGKGCTPLQVTFQNLSTDSCVYFWRFGDGQTSSVRNPVHTYTAAGTYTVTLSVRDTLHCLNIDSVSQQIVVADAPTLTFDPVIPVCRGESLTLQVQGANTYRWLPNGSFPGATGGAVTVTPLQNTVYQVIGTNTIGCSDTASVLVPVNQFPDIIPFRDTTLCLGDSLLLTINPNPQAFSTWGWLSGSGLADTSASTIVLSGERDRDYILRLQATTGCVIYDTVSVKVKVTVTASAGADKLACKQTPLVLNASGGSRYLWSTGATTSSITVNVTSSGFAWVVAYNGACRSLPDTVNFELDTIKADFTWVPDTVFAPGTARFLPQGNGIYTAFWDLDSTGFRLPGDTARRFYENPGLFPARLVLVNPVTGCRDTSAWRYVPVQPVAGVLPNVFTPNNDGLNDVFSLLGLNMQSATMTIYSRWGELVFETDRLDLGWDGRHKGRPAPPENYLYFVKAIGRNGLPYEWQGMVTLVR